MEVTDHTGTPYLLRPNQLYPPFDKPAVRRALMGAIDQKEFMIAAMGEDASLWQVPMGFFPQLSPLASDAGMQALTSKRDPAKVKKDLEAAGYNGEKVVFMVGTDQPVLKSLSDVALDMLKRVGMNVDYQATDWGSVVQRRALTKPPAEGGWNLFCTGFSGLDWFTPASHLPLRGNGKSAWFGWPDDPKMEAMRDAWFNAPDLAGAEEDRRRDAASGVRQRAVLSAWIGAIADCLSQGHHRRAGRVRDLLERAPHLIAGPPPGRPHPVIVIFGAAVRPGGRPSGTLLLRVESAVAFGARFAEPLFVPTGGVGRFGPSEASVMAAMLEARGVPRGRILLEETGTDTLSSARAVVALLRTRGIAAPVFVATSLYHQPRCLLVLRLLGVRARAAVPPMPAATHWWRRCYWWLREVPAIPYDAVLAVWWRIRR